LVIDNGYGSQMFASLPGVNYQSHISLFPHLNKIKFSLINGNAVGKSSYDDAIAPKQLNVGTAALTNFQTFKYKN
jgi:hypothetical protein